MARSKHNLILTSRRRRSLLSPLSFLFCTCSVEPSPRAGHAPALVVRRLRYVVKRLLAQIVGFRIEIEKIEGKFKLNQNHPVERRQKVERALQRRGDENPLAVAAMMQAMLPAKGEVRVVNVVDVTRNRLATPPC